MFLSINYAMRNNSYLRDEFCLIACAIDSFKPHVRIPSLVSSASPYAKLTSTF